MKPIAVIGAGISGLACARMLSDEGFKVTVYEKNTSIGGLVSCESINDNLYHKVGGHVFNSNNSKVLEWFWSHFDKEREFTRAARNAVIHLDDKFVKYPIELNINELPRDIAGRIVTELIDLSSRPQKDALSFENLGEFFAGNFGETLYRIYFEPYNSKIWKRDLKKISMQWLAGKLPMIPTPDILKQNIIKQADNMVHATFFYPKWGGSQFIAERISRGLVVTTKDVTKIVMTSRGFKINGSHMEYDKIVYTGDIRKLENCLDPENKYLLERKGLDFKSIKSLDSNGTTTVLCECDANDYSWVYLPAKNVMPHRIIMTGNFSENNNSRELLRSSRISCTVEFSGQVDYDLCCEEIMKLPFDMRLLAYNYCQDSYVIHSVESLYKVNCFIRRLRHEGIYCCGRFAEWQYYNMDAAIESAFKLVDDIKEDAG